MTNVSMGPKHVMKVSPKGKMGLHMCLSTKVGKCVGPKREASSQNKDCFEAALSPEAHSLAPSLSISAWPELLKTPRATNPGEKAVQEIIL